MRIQYKTEIEKAAIVAEYVTEKGYRIVKEENHIDGNFLTFGPPTEWHTLDSDTKQWIFNKSKWIDAVVRPERDRILRGTDYLMIVDVREKMDVEDIEKLKTYRQDLRDIPQTVTNIKEPVDIFWPEKPIIRVIE